MSLVAYDASSDEASENEEEESLTTSPRSKPTAAVTPSSDDEFETNEIKPNARTFALPKPKNCGREKSIMDEMDEHVTPTFAKLPMPKKDGGASVAVEEEDDEFLHKKAVPPPEVDSKLKEHTARGPVKITIPSLKDFNDVDKDKSSKAKNQSASLSKSKGSGLLSLLPTAKSEQNFAKVTEDTTTEKRPENATAIKKPAFVPDSVKNRRPAHNTEGVDGIKPAPRKIQKPKISLVDCSDSDGSDEEGSGGDFFSLNNDDKLPEVNANEIHAMVAKRAAKIAETTTKYLSISAAAKESTDEMQPDEEDVHMAEKRRQMQQLDQDAVQALVGSRAKRRRREQEQIQVMDISSDQVLPDREEWMRTALASSTTYQPTGVLVDEEPVAGTRRKHQITYLAHKAKANEAELQAMWSANRHNRRATQSKYGF